MPAVIVGAACFAIVVGMRGVDKVAYLLIVVFVILSLVVFADLSFYVDESVSALASALAAGLVAKGLAVEPYIACECKSYLLNVIVVFVILFIFILVLIVIILAAATR